MIQPSNLSSSRLGRSVRNLFCMVPGGGVEPPRGCPRRILSLILGVLHWVAVNRNMPHKHFDMNALPQGPPLQSVAQKRTKVGNEQPSKRPLKTAPTVNDLTITRQTRHRP